MALFFFCLPRPRDCHPLPPSPWFPLHPPWLLNISSTPFLSLFLLSIFIPCFSLFSLFAVCMNWNPPIATTHRDPRSGKFNQILYTHMASQIIPLLYLYIPEF